MTLLRLQVITPQETFFDGEVNMVILRAVGGDIGVLPGHIPMMTILGSGKMLVMSGDHRRTAFISGGFAEILPERTTVLADEANWC